MDVFIKKVEQHELKMTRLMDAKGLAPNLILEERPKRKKVQIHLEKYPYTLHDYLERFESNDRLKKSVLDKVEEMHGHGIVHGDLHKENIVVRPLDGGDYEVKFIDFSESIDSWDWYDEHNIENFNEFCAAKCGTIEEVFEFELNMVSEYF